MPDGVRAFGLDRVSAYILFLAIAGPPLPVGSRTPMAVAIWCLILGLGLLFASTRHLRAGHLVLLGGIGVIALCYAFVLHEQLSGSPWVAAPNPIWAKTSEILRQPITPSVSILRGEPFYALGPSLACLLALTLGLVVGADKDNADRALLVMAWAGVVYAVYGLATVLLGPGIFPWQERSAQQAGYLTGTFINRNTAASYFGSCAAVWLVLVMSSMRRRLPAGPITWSRAIDQLAGEKVPQKELIVRSGMFLVCLTAMFMTASRGGILLSLFAMALSIVIFFRRDLPRGKSLIVLAIGAVVFVLILLQFLGGQVEGRIDAAGLSDQGRLEAYRSTLRLIADNPWFGTGLGTFAWAFPPYRSPDISILGVWDKAHSTPLELAAELGIPFAVLIGLGWVVAIVVLVHGTRRSRLETVAPLAALSVALIANLHSAIDFSLQVSGYAIVVFAIVGVGLAQSLHAETTERVVRRRRKSNSTDGRSSEAEAAV